MREYKGIFPETVPALLELPGIGPYTAAAISSIAFDRQAVAVDGNVERVVSRFFAVREPLPLSKPVLREKAALLAKANPSPADFTQAFMELGATVCTPKSPKCGSCPWRRDCAARKAGIAEELPRKVSGRKKPVRHGKVFWIQRRDGRFCIHKRPEGGLYGGLYQLPTTLWETKPSAARAEPAFGGKVRLETAGLQIRHSFTHFDLVLEVWTGTASASGLFKGAVWISADEAENYALPSLMRKAIGLCLPRGLQKQ
jgi:A/G-specific adenine glycosylase